MLLLAAPGPPDIMYPQPRAVSHLMIADGPAAVAINVIARLRGPRFPVPCQCSGRLPVGITDLSPSYRAAQIDVYAYVTDV